MHTHDIKVGQYINLLIQSNQIGLSDNWPDINRQCTKANVVLGNIPKITPPSKFVGDLSQLMVYRDMSLVDVSSRAKELEIPKSVVQYLRIDIGVKVR